MPWLGGVGKSDFNENPVISPDLDLNFALYGALLHEGERIRNITIRITEIKMPSVTKLTNPKSKSEVQVQVWADDWVFIKIRFSNQPATHPASHPPGKVSKKQDRAILPK